MDMEILHQCKELIEENDLDKLKEVYQNILHVYHDMDYRPCWEYIFQQVYIHACLRKRKEIAEWLQKTIFPSFDVVSQIGVRQTFSYGNYLLRK